MTKAVSTAQGSRSPPAGAGIDRTFPAPWVLRTFVVAALGQWVGACGAAVVFERVADGVYAHVGDIVYVDGLLAVLPVSSTRAWLDAFTALEQWAPRRVVQSGSVIGEIPDQVGVYQ